MTTSSVAIFVPFTTQELFQDGKEALYYGLNALSNNLIMVDRKLLKNPNGLILGTPGSGKSFSAKREISNVFLVTNDDVLICDPEDEYAPLVIRLGGQVVKISPTSNQYVNPMDINLNYSDDDNPLALKADFILSLCDIVVGSKDGLQPVEKTVIDRAVRNVYRPYLADPDPEKMPILQDLYDELLRQPEPEAKRVAAALELYVTGSLNVFNHRTNVELENRLVCFNIKELGKQLKQLGMLVIQDQVWNRVTVNRAAGKTTRYYCDEFHLLFKGELASWSVEIWKRFRKWGGIPTGITQNIKDLLASREIENIFENTRLHLYAQSGSRGPADIGQAAQHQPAPAFLCDPLRRGRGASVLRECHSAFPGSVPQGHGAVPHHDHQAPGGIGMRQEPRLQFTKEERAAPELEKPIRKADRAADKAEKARAKIPKKKIRFEETVTDPATGKTVTRLRFEEVDKKKPPSKLSHAVRDAPGNAVLSKVHKEIRESEEDNVGVESAHKMEEAAETGGRMIESAYHSHKLKPYREAAKAEKKLEKANINALYHKSLRDNPQLASNPLSRWQQKHAIKKQYAAAKRAGQTAGSTAKAAEQTAKTAKTAAKKSEQAAQFVWRHRRGFLVGIALVVILCFLLNTMSSCSMMFESVGSGVAGSTYPSRDEDMLGAEAAYAQMEAELQDYLDNYEATHDYDEYHFDLDEIVHDPYVLISILTAYHQGEWTLAEVEGTLSMLFERQYILTEEVVVETRYRTETSTDPETGETTSEQVPYDYYICYVTLENFDLSHLPVYIMGEEQVSLYAVYMATLGNRPDLFEGNPNASTSGSLEFTDYDIPPEALEDETFRAMITEAEKYLGYPYVWGGSSPSTSFDCSGFISWVINHSGWDVGRLTANGLLNISTPVSRENAQPGDLIFFQGTYNTAGASHVGLYVGDGMMIHCGYPISYANINTCYWQQHFYTFARLP